MQIRRHLKRVVRVRLQNETIIDEQDSVGVFAVFEDDFLILVVDRRALSNGAVRWQTGVQFEDEF